MSHRTAKRARHHDIVHRRDRFNACYFSAKSGAQSTMFERADQQGHVCYIVHEQELGARTNQRPGNEKKSSRSYASYRNHEEFLSMYLKLKSPRQLHFYEIIREQIAVRFYLDIEFKTETRDDDGARESVHKLLDMCTRVFASEVNVTIDNTDWVIQDGGRECDLDDGRRGWKHSFHVNLASVYFADNATVLKPFMGALRLRMEESNDPSLFWTPVSTGLRQPIVDFGTNTRNRAWRLPLSSKAWDTKPLQLLTEHEIIDALVTVPPSKDSIIISGAEVSHLASIQDKPCPRARVARTHTSRPREASDDSGLIAKLTQILRKYGDTTSTVEHELEHETNASSKTRVFVGKTVQTRTCPWGYVHGSNNFYLALASNGTVWYHCHGTQPCSGKSQAIGVLNAHDDDFDLDLSGIHTVDVYNEQHVRPYRTKATKALLVKSGMNTGKTHMLCKTLRHERYTRVIVVTTRIAFAMTMLSALRPLGFKLYKDVEDVRNENMLIIEYESLHKLLGSDGTIKPFDCIVLDEIESLLCNTSSVTNGSFLQVNKAVFEGLVKSTDNLYAMDADLSNKSVQFFKDTLGGNNITLQYNERQSMERKIVVNEKLEDWLGRIHESLCAGKRFVVATGSKKIADAHVIPLIEAAATTLGRPVRYRFYHSDCDDALLDDFDRIDDAWSELDVVVFTSKVTVGADFSVRGHFDHIFMYGCAGSVSPRVMLQMCGRCRYPADTIIYACVPPSKEGARITLAKIQEKHRTHLNTMNDVGARILGANASFDHNAGVIRIQPSPGWIGTVFAFNCLEEERSRADFRGELIRAASAKGYSVEVDKTRATATSEIPDKSTADTVLKARRVREFDETQNIDFDEAAEIEKRQGLNRATTIDKRKIAKFNYQRLFPCDVDGMHYVSVGNHIGLLIQICLSLRSTPLATVLERDVATWRYGYAEMATVKFTRYDLVRKVANLLGLTNELDTTTDVSSDRILAENDGLNALVPSLWSERIIRDKFQRQGLKKLVGLTNSVFSSWCGGRLKTTRKKHRRCGKSGKRVCVYTYRLTFSTVYKGKTLVDIAKDTVFYKDPKDT